MVDAGVARKVDFGEGRFRFEHSYRHPRHFHLICKTCNRSSEFLSSDIEGLIEEIAAALLKQEGWEVIGVTLRLFAERRDAEVARPGGGKRHLARERQSRPVKERLVLDEVEVGDVDGLHRPARLDLPALELLLVAHVELYVLVERPRGARVAREPAGRIRVPPP